MANLTCPVCGKKHPAETDAHGVTQAVCATCRAARKKASSEAPGTAVAIASSQRKRSPK